MLWLLDHVIIFMDAFVKPKAIIFGFSLFLSMSAFIIWAQEHKELEQMGAFVYQDHFYAPVYVLLLPFGAFALWLNRPLTNLIALVTSGLLIYRLTFLSWLGYAHAHDACVLSSVSLSMWWRVMYEYQPQDIFYLVAAVLIFIYASILFLQFVCKSMFHIGQLWWRGNA